jgi:phage shock protein C
MKKLYRSTQDKKVAGICGGLGEYFEVDSNIIRILMILFFVFSGLLGIVFYLLGWVIIPEEGKERIKKRFARASDGKVIAGVCKGIANYFDVDVLAVRIVFIITSILTGFIPVIIFYVLVWLFVPLDEDDFEVIN